jgi:hypothetical protein
VPNQEFPKAAVAAARNVGRAAPTADSSKTEILKEIKLLQKTTRQHAKEAADETHSSSLARTIEEARDKTMAGRSAHPAQSRPAKSEATNASPSAKSVSMVPVLVNPEFATGEIATSPESKVTVLPSGPLKSLNNFHLRDVPLSKPNETPLIFELPVTYNERVKSWLQFFQNEGRHSFKLWLERSARWLPYIHGELGAAGLPQDLIYVAMIESGFAPDAVSPAEAVGMWQFIRPTVFFLW